MLVYWTGLGGGFIFDDYPNLVEDSDWKVTSLEWANLQGVLGSGIASVFGRPLAVLSFAFNHYFSGLDPWSMKLTGVVLHLFNAALVYLLCLRLFQLLPGDGKPGRFAAWLLAAVWMVHPLQASTVLYVVQRMEVGAHTGVLLALLAYLRGREAQRDGERSWPWWLVTVVAGLVGLGFKETALLLPGYALVLEVCLLHFCSRTGRSRGLVALYAAGIVAAVMVYFWKVVPAAMAPHAYAFRDFTLTERLLSQLAALTLYLKQILLAWPESLWFYYDNFPVSHGLFQPIATFWGLVCLAGILGAAWACWRRWPLVTLGLLWFLVAHFLTSNIVSLELVFEHRNYFALLGVLLALMQPLGWVGRALTPGVRKVVGVLPLVFVGLMGVIQTSTWGDPMRLALALSSRNPESVRAGYELGRLLLERAQGDVASPLWSLAEQEFHHAARLPGRSPLPEQALIILAATYGRPLPEDIWPSLRSKLAGGSAGPQQLGAVESLVECRIAARCRFGDEQELFDTLQVALGANPKSARVHAMYGNYAFNVMRDPVLAVAMLQDAVRLSPGEEAYRVGLARFVVASNLRDSQAEQALSALRRLNTRGQYDGDLKQLEQMMAADGDGESQGR